MNKAMTKGKRKVPVMFSSYSVAAKPQIGGKLPSYKG